MAVGDGSDLAFIDVGAGKLVRGSLMNQSSGSLNIAWWCKSMCNVHVKCLRISEPTMIRLGEVLLDVHAWRFELEEVALHILSFLDIVAPIPLGKQVVSSLTHVIVNRARFAHRMIYCLYFGRQAAWRPMGCKRIGVVWIGCIVSCSCCVQ